MYQMLPVHVHVSNATVDCSCIKCYSNMFMYKMYLTEYHIFIKIGVSNYTSPLCQFLTVTFRVFHNPVEKCCGIVEKCHLHAYVWICEHCIKCT